MRTKIIFIFYQDKQSYMRWENDRGELLGLRRTTTDIASAPD